jgi:hypothetical protein
MEQAFSAEHVNKSQDGQLLVSRETTDDGTLGEVFKGKSCQSASVDILTDQWTSTCELHSPTRILQMSNSNTVPVENHTSNNSYLMARMVNSHTALLFIVVDAYSSTGPYHQI